MSNQNSSVPTLVNVAPLPSVYFEPSAGRYFIRNKHGEWMSVTFATAESYIVSLGYSRTPAKGEDQSEAECIMLRIQLEKCVHYAGPLAGYKPGPRLVGTIRALVTKAVQPVAPAPGDWPVFQKLLTNMFGDKQLPHLLGWIKQTLAMLRSGKPLTGQALCICGPAGAGKSLLGEVLTKLFGGEPGHPWKYMNDKTQFNSDLFGSVLLLVDDAAESTDNRVRRAFGANIKQIVAARPQACHKKYAEQLSLRPLWRLMILLNDDPERLMVLPPLDADIDSKLMLFKVEAHRMPMPTATPENEEAFMNTLVSELPAFVDYLDGWAIPTHIADTRFGVVHYHHPEVVRDLGETTPEERLKEMIDEAIFGTTKVLLNNPEPWVGNAAGLLRILTGKDSDCAREAEKLLAGGRAVCGKYLARLAKEHPERFSQHKEEGLTIWTIQPSSGWSKAKYPSFSEETAARVRARSAALLTAEASSANPPHSTEWEAEPSEFTGQGDDVTSLQPDACLVP